MTDVLNDPARRRAWRSALLHALPGVAVVLCLCTYWFAVADRYTVFLYHHDMGPLYPDTSPFSVVTGSRYWMASLVASGAVMVLYTIASWLLGRLVASYRAPAWWRVWIICAPVLLISIPTITMTVNAPTLPVRNAVQVTLAALIGAGLALLPGKLAAEAPGALAWLTAQGSGLMLVMIFLVHVEKIRGWLARGRAVWVWMMALSVAAGVIWLLVLTVVQAWLRRRVPSAAALYAAGMCLAYLLMPLVHHVLGTNGYFYITNSDNFLAQSAIVQIVAWLALAGLVMGVTKLGQHLAAQRAAAGRSM